VTVLVRFGLILGSVMMRECDRFFFYGNVIEFDGVGCRGEVGGSVT
jgi:hypothetical protein